MNRGRPTPYSFLDLINMTRRNKMNLKRMITILILVSILFINGCSKTVDIKEDIKITIAYPNKSFFYEKYGKDFEFEFPHIQIDVIEKPIAELNEFDDVDVLFINN